MAVFRRSLILLLLLVSGAAHSRAQSGDTVIVLPFENTSGKAEFNWVGESFADSLSDLLAIPGTFHVVSNDRRKIQQQKLRIPLSTIPSLATSLKLAREAHATWLISGRYTILPASGDTVATISVRAMIISVNEGRFWNQGFPDGAKIPPLELTDALGNLQTIQGQLAHKILYFHDGNALGFSQNEMITRATKVPGRAFEAYVKGLLTSDPTARENYLTNALREYAKVDPEGTYSEAALELGHLFSKQRQYPEAIDAFERVISANQKCHERAQADKKPASCGDEAYAEASFYIGMIFWQQGNYETALATMRPLADDLKLTTVYNALGAIAVQASRAEKKNDAKAAGMLNDGIVFLKKASDSAPEDNQVRFNYATALFLAGNMQDAATQLRAAIAASPRDGEAYYLLAKTLESLKDPLAATIDNQARLNLAANNRYAELEKEWGKSKTVTSIRLRVQQPERKDFVSVIISRNADNVATAPPKDRTQELLDAAKASFKAGDDDAALESLRKIVSSDPMAAEAYILLGKISLKRGDKDQAISQFKTAIFWDNKLVEAHVNLGKIYVDKGDCLQAKNYAASAAEVDPENIDVQALQRLAERCSK
jgi:tetratricopeptide (TPR) repeat protein